MTRQKGATKKVIQAQNAARQDAVSDCLASAVAVYYGNSLLIKITHVLNDANSRKSLPSSNMMRVAPLHHCKSQSKSHKHDSFKSNESEMEICVFSN
jgi:hypothetical protein